MVWLGDQGSPFNRIRFSFFLSAGPSAVCADSCGKRVFHSRGSVAEAGGTGPTAANDKQRQAPDLASWFTYAIRPSAYTRIGIRRAGITASRNRATAESDEFASAKKAHCTLLRLLSLESLSEPWAGVRKIARHGFYQCEGSLSRQQLRRGLGRQGVSG